MKRRTFVSGLGAVLAAPRAAEAQQPAGKVYKVGTLSIVAPASLEQQTDWWSPFMEAVRELNYVEGRNLLVKRASAAGRGERLPALARDLVRANVDIIVTTSTRETRAAKDATSAIPIVMTFAPDPVGQELVSSLARPGGNVTGLTSLVPGMRQKWVELLKEAVPSASRFAVIATPAQLVPDILGDMEAAAKRLGVSLSPVAVESPQDFEPAVIRVQKDGASGIIAAADPITIQNRRAFVSTVQKHRLPAIYWAREYVEVGGLMTYSANLVHLRRRAALYVDKIFKGAKPADLPVEQPTTFEFVINLKTAKALGLTIPPSLLLLADQVIE